ncbi:MAG: hypothetical protein NZ827_03530 [Aquificaceae bacterium]|nr:hypothetical protein [Aquificaceae bacterium]
MMSLFALMVYMPLLFLLSGFFNHGAPLFVGTGGTTHTMKCAPSVDRAKDFIVELMKQHGG